MLYPGGDHGCKAHPGYPSQATAAPGRNVLLLTLNSEYPQDSTTNNSSEQLPHGAGAIPEL
ncbi:hypothetical protein I79_015293 [Cricetulus griseus]|uniref:Uncharacterized protein n=1 Tax=Cricetulus griseus TaxID=10029 RepID=G3HWD6_CRIGR|nr:hypothetical protein I79_015293 [Cricetulus griseus]